MGKGSRQVNRFMRENQPKSKEQIAYDRKVSIKRTTSRLNSMKRTIESKKEQIKTGNIIETRSVHKLADGTAAIVDGFVDNKKPKYLLENEIEELETQKELFEEELKHLEEEDAKATSNGG